MTIREITENIEKDTLSKFASLSSCTKGREVNEEKCDIRAEYQRDRDRILHSKAFRRLKHKTQVFLAPEGDHFRTRLTHTLEVSQIARTIARALRLNEDLTEAIALGHDLGHTPFGHAGERALNEISSTGYKHFEQSVRVVSNLENNGKGLNLTFEVKNGILCHTAGTQADTFEGRVVRFSDKIAYINHDIDDAVRAGVLKEEEIPMEFSQVLGKKRSERISTLVNSIVYSSDDDIKMELEIQDAFWGLRAYMFKNVYENQIVKEEEKKVSSLIHTLFNYFNNDIDKLPLDYRGIATNDGKERAVCDYISGMSDSYAIMLYTDITIPKAWNIKL